MTYIITVPGSGTQTVSRRYVRLALQLSAFSVCYRERGRVLLLGKTGSFKGTTLDIRP